jgi:trk system potassium uptake protein TrkH
VVSAVLVTIMFIGAVVFSVFFILIAEPSLNISDAAGLAIAAVTNSGADLSSVAFHDMGDITKVFLAVMMWVGRLEVIIAMMLFTRTFWSDLFMGIRRGGAKRKRA